MSFYLFYLLFILICESESGPSKAVKPKPFHKIIDGYIKSIHQLTEQFPEHVIEIAVEFSAPINMFSSRPRKIKPHNKPRKKVLGPRGILRDDYDYSDPVDDNVVTSTNKTTTKAVTLEGTTTDGATTTEEKTTTPVSTATAETSSDSVGNPIEPTKQPIYYDDLVKAFEIFNKFNPTIDENGNNGNSNNYDSWQPTAKQQRVQDIWQLMEKGLQVEFNVPPPTDDPLEWLQVELPVTE